MDNTSQNELFIDSDKALKLLRDQFPNLSINDISFLGVGLDNKAYLVNQELVFRFPTRKETVSLLKNEFSLLLQIAPYLTLPVPVPLFVSDNSQQFPLFFSGYRMIAGQTAEQANLSDGDREQLAVPLAKFLVSLHTISAQTLKNITQEDTFQKMDITLLVSRINSYLEDIQTLGLFEHTEQLYNIVTSAAHIHLEKKEVLLHGDLYARHLLINNMELAGVIDWGYSMVGHPGIDLAIAHSFLPPAAHEIFRKAYGEISHSSWVFARLRALYHSLILVIYGHQSGDKLLFQEGQRALKYLM